MPSEDIGDAGLSAPADRLRSCARRGEGHVPGGQVVAHLRATGCLDDAEEHLAVQALSAEHHVAHEANPPHTAVFPIRGPKVDAALRLSAEGPAAVAGGSVP